MKASRLVLSVYTSDGSDDDDDTFYIHVTYLVFNYI